MVGVVAHGAQRGVVALAQDTDAVGAAVDEVGGGLRRLAVHRRSLFRCRAPGRPQRRGGFLAVRD